MFGNKLRSWMDAVRSRKKQHRKEKQGKSNNLVSGRKNNVKWDTDCATEYKENERCVSKNHPLNENQSQSGSSAGVSNSRYSANNLSSPESAYSTGYSTDGTSPGAPPENLLNTPKVPDICHPRVAVLNPIQNPNIGNVKSTLQPNVLPTSTKILSNPLKDQHTPVFKKRELEESKFAPASRINEKVIGNLSPALGITSPRQRNRIRTNPWLPGSTLSPSPVKHNHSKTMVVAKSAKDSPKLRRFLSPVASRRRSLSTSSSSSLSATSIQLEVPRPKSISDEDCTLNEMMGKYDESYVYEKETDILSDSDPTDCETDIDTGQDGGDEDDPFEAELDFIDNGSFLDYEISRTDLNTGHCSYYNYDIQRKISSRRRPQRQRKANKASEKKRKSCSNKKRQSKQFEKEKRINTYVDGSKSAGATPVSIRRANCRPISKLALDDGLRKRSNSVGFCRDPISTIDKRDKEADLKYRELITEAEQILHAMKNNGLSPRRVPGPANKRVELLRITECAKPEIFIKNRPPAEETVITNPFCSKIPSNSNYNCPRFSPKKNHITKFIISNSPVLAKKEGEMQSHIYKSPISNRKLTEYHHVSLKDKHTEGVRISPKHRRKLTKRVTDSSSDSDDVPRRNKLSGSCPQSEPVRRKVYFGSNNNQKLTGVKTVAFNLTTETLTQKECTMSNENLRQQVLLNTIVNLKKNLEDHSASLKQVYRSSHNIYA